MKNLFFIIVYHSGKKNHWISSLDYAQDRTENSIYVFFLCFLFCYFGRLAVKLLKYIFCGETAVNEREKNILIISSNLGGEFRGSARNNNLKGFFCKALNFSI